MTDLFIYHQDESCIQNIILGADVRPGGHIIRQGQDFLQIPSAIEPKCKRVAFLNFTERGICFKNDP